MLYTVSAHNSDLLCLKSTKMLKNIFISTYKNAQWASNNFDCFSYHCLSLVMPAAHPEQRGHTSQSHPILLQMIQGTGVPLGYRGAQRAEVRQERLRRDAQPLISKLGMWIMFQLQIIFTWEHCLLIKAIKITWSFCICKQFCIWALFTSTTVALLKLVCKTANIRTNIMLTKANIKVAVSLYFPTLDSFFISRNCLSNIFLFNPCPRYFAKKMQERTAGSKTTKQTE